MKRPLSSALWLLASLLLVLSSAGASPLILDKDVRGSILTDRLTLSLKAAACDATQEIIPDESKLVSERFTLQVGDDGVGYFAGTVRIVTPDGRIVARGLLRGTAGLSARPSSLDACTAPGRLDGLLEATPATSTTRPTTSTTDPAGAAEELALRPPPMLLHFAAILIPQNTDALYEGSLRGLFIPPPPPPPAVLVKPDRLEYRPVDPISAIVANQSGRVIQAYDMKTDCTILWLQRMVAGEWKNVADCAIEKVTQPVQIKPGESLAVTLRGPAAPGREPGAYRLALEFHYLNEAGEPEADTLTVVSPVFRVVTVQPPPTGPVVVAPERQEYRSNEPIRAIVANKGEKPVGSIPDETHCTIVSLQRLVNGAWQAQGACAYFIPPEPVILAAGATLVVTLPPGEREVNHAPGTYRMVVTYQYLDAENKPAGEFMKAVSPEFRVVSVTPPPTEVRVNPGRSIYRSNEPILASVTNGSPSPIQANAWHSYCTILQLQRQVDNGWTMEGGCPLDGGPTITIAPGQTYPVVLPPKESNFPDRTPGTYRLVLTYFVTDAAGQTGEPLHAVSPLFQIVAGTPPAVVKVAPDKPGYAATDVITAVLQNGTVPVLLKSNKTLCTVVALQKAVEAGWETVMPCPPDSTDVTRNVILQPGQALSVPLARDATWDPGRYRLAISYFALDANGQPTGTEMFAASTVFPVGNVTPPTPSMLLAPSKEAYAANEPIKAILKNGQVPVRIFDMQSFCTIVQLQRAESGMWVPIGPCLMKRLPIPIYLKPGQEEVISLPPDTANTVASWRPGMYRLAVTYAPVAEDGTVIGRDQSVFTRPFPVGTLPPPTGLVTVKPDRVAYGLDGRIVALLQNGTEQIIRSFKGTSFCTIVALEKLTNGVWAPIEPCMLASLVAEPVDIPAGETLRVPLPPETRVPAWTPGVYRLRLRYVRLDANKMPVPPYAEAFSDRFSVGLDTTTSTGAGEPVPVFRLPR